MDIEKMSINYNHSSNVLDVIAPKKTRLWKMPAQATQHILNF